jgi:hypothetical protein
LRTCKKCNKSNRFTRNFTPRQNQSDWRNSRSGYNGNRRREGNTDRLSKGNNTGRPRKRFFKGRPKRSFNFKNRVNFVATLTPEDIIMEEVFDPEVFSVMDDGDIVFFVDEEENLHPLGMVEM